MLPYPGQPWLTPPAGPVRRIVVVGNCGAGKSRLSREIADRLGLPVVHLDLHYWRPGWTKPSSGEWRATVAALVAEDEWVLDGNYGSTFDVRLPRAEVIVWLDPHRLVCVYRALSRFWKGRRRRRVDLAEGCDEALDRDFLRYIWRYRKQHAPRLLAAIEEHAAGTPVVRLATNRQVRRFLVGVQRRSLLS